MLNNVNQSRNQQNINPQEESSSNPRDNNPRTISRELSGSLSRLAINSQNRRTSILDDNSDFEDIELNNRTETSTLATKNEPKNRGCGISLKRSVGDLGQILRNSANKSLTNLSQIFYQKNDITNDEIEIWKKLGEKKKLDGLASFSEQEKIEFNKLELKLRLKNRKQFLENPAATLEIRPVKESRSLMNIELDETGARAKDRKAEICNMRISSMFNCDNSIILEKLRPEAELDGSEISMHYLPFNGDKANTITLNDKADYFYTSQLAGCSLAIDLTDIHHPKIVHMAGTFGTINTPLRQVEEWGAAELETEENWNSSFKFLPIEYLSEQNNLQNVKNYACRDSNSNSDLENNFIGVRNPETNTWRFFVQTNNLPSLDETNVKTLEQWPGE